MPVLPLVGSMMTVSGFDLPGLAGRVNQGDADAVPSRWTGGLKEFEFEQHVGDRAVFLRRAIQPHERGVAKWFQ